MSTAAAKNRILELESLHESEITDDEQAELNQLANESEASKLSRAEMSYADLVKSNIGFNPELATGLGDYELVNNGTVLVVNGRAYNRTDAKNVRDYIESYPRHFGLILAGRFFTEEA